mmetsp:Transcript_14238/g.32507  ORF Transcript_14238/g.32507 Transcript_14238/m.32507 type:complete len:210 (+) Transcript_14238:205-834(+)
MRHPAHSAALPWRADGLPPASASSLSEAKPVTEPALDPSAVALPSLTSSTSADICSAWTFSSSVSSNGPSSAAALADSSCSSQAVGPAACSCAHAEPAFCMPSTSAARSDASSRTTAPRPMGGATCSTRGRRPLDMFAAATLAHIAHAPSNICSLSAGSEAYNASAACSSSSSRSSSSPSSCTTCHKAPSTPSAGRKLTTRASEIPVDG